MRYDRYTKNFDFSFCVILPTYFSDLDGGKLHKRINFATAIGTMLVGCYDEDCDPSPAYIKIDFEKNKVDLMAVHRYLSARCLPTSGLPGTAKFHADTKPIMHAPIAHTSCFVTQTDRHTHTLSLSLSLSLTHTCDTHAHTQHTHVRVEYVLVPEHVMTQKVPIGAVESMLNWFCEEHAQLDAAEVQQHLQVAHMCVLGWKSVSADHTIVFLSFLRAEVQRFGWI